MPDAVNVLHPRRARRPMGAMLYGGLVLIGVLVCGLGLQPFTPSWVVAEEPVTMKAPAFSLMDLQGKPRSLAEFLNATPILLEFMSPDCPHCREMAPVLTRLHARYRDRVQFVTVAFDKSVPRIQQFAALEKHGWPYLLGSQDVVNAYRLEGVPTFCFVAPEGRLVNRVAGSLPEEVLRQHLDSLLQAR
jgi:thiol-disulfide isomerase/thioredoxin